MTSRRRIATPERRARIARRHALAPKARVGSVVEAARAVVVLHGTDVASVYLQSWARMRESSIVGIGDELYTDRSVLRMLAMRRTLFVAPLDEVATLHHAASLAVARTERARTLAMFASADGVGPDPGELFEELARIGLAAIREQGEATTAELTALDPRLAVRIRVAQGKSLRGVRPASRSACSCCSPSRGASARGRPRGTWKGTQVRWAPIECWLPKGIPPMSRPSRPKHVSWADGCGRSDRVPVTTSAGGRAGLSRPSVRRLPPMTRSRWTSTGGATGWVLPDDLDPEPDPGPWVAVLPALDATTMAGPTGSGTSARTGHACSTLPATAAPRSGSTAGSWVAGRSAHRARSPRRYLEDVGADAREAVAAQVTRLAAWLGTRACASSFPTPLEVELRAS